MFVLAGCGTYLVLLAASRSAPRKIFVAIALTGAVWVVFFSADYLLLLRKLNADTYLHNYWTGGYAPLPPRSWADFQWYGWALWQFVEVTMGFKQLQWVMVISSLLGILAVLVRRKLQEWLFLFPVAFALLASGLSSYPLLDRLILWIVPLAVLAICAGVAEFSQVVPNRFRHATPVLAGVLLVYPLYAAFNLTFRSPGKVEEVRDALRYLDAQVPMCNTIYYNPSEENVLDFYFQTHKWSHLNRGECRPLEVPAAGQMTLPPEARGRTGILLAHLPDESSGQWLAHDLTERGRIIKSWQDIDVKAIVAEVH